MANIDIRACKQLGFMRHFRIVLEGRISQSAFWADSEWSEHGILEALRHWTDCRLRSRSAIYLPNVRSDGEYCRVYVDGRTPIEDRRVPTLGAFPLGHVSALQNLRNHL